MRKQLSALITSAILLAAASAANAEGLALKVDMPSPLESKAAMENLNNKEVVSNRIRVKRGAPEAESTAE